MSTSASPPPQPSPGSQPLFWLLLLLVLAVGLRWTPLHSPLQQDEFGPLYAIAEREGFQRGLLPSRDQPLRPVASWNEVRERSVLPYGVENPYPLYHWLLYALIHWLPITEVTLRLPSLLAGLATIACLYELGRRLIGPAVGLAAALFVTVDPMQIEVSVLTRPYALGNLACALSLGALLALLNARTFLGGLFAALALGLTTALIGYLNAVLLLVGVAYVGLVVYWLVQCRRPVEIPPETEPLPAEKWSLAGHPEGVGRKLGFLVLAVALGIALLVPMQGYYQRIHAFTDQHRPYLLATLPPRAILFLLFQNWVWLVALFVITVLSYFFKPATSPAASTPPVEQGTPASAPATPATAPPQPLLAPAENPDLPWTGRLWMFFPQLAGVILVYALNTNDLLAARYFTYTALGGALLLAYYGTRGRSREVRLVVPAAAAGVMLLLSYLQPVLSLGLGLKTDPTSQIMIESLKGVQRGGSWKKGDVVLYRSNFRESDLLPSIPESQRDQLEGALIAPLSTLYVLDQSVPYIQLSLSHYRNDQIHTQGGDHFLRADIYTKALEDRLKGYQRYWLVTPAWQRTQYFACLIPWLATVTNSDLEVASTREGAEHYFRVNPGLPPEQPIPRLDEARSTDFTSVVLVKRLPPPKPAEK